MKFRFSHINIPLIVRNLRSVCNWMIAFEGFCTAFNLLSYLFLTPVLNGLWPKMPTLDCFIFQVPFGFAYEMMAMMPFAIGAERFVVAFFPLWFAFFILFDSIFKKSRHFFMKSFRDNRKERRIFIAAIFFICAFRGIFIEFLITQNVFDSPFV